MSSGLFLTGEANYNVYDPRDLTPIKGETKGLTRKEHARGLQIEEDFGYIQSKSVIRGKVRTQDIDPLKNQRKKDIRFQQQVAGHAREHALDPVRLYNDKFQKQAEDAVVGHPSKDVTQVTIASWDLDGSGGVTLPSNLNVTHVKVDSVAITSFISNVNAGDAGYDGLNHNDVMFRDTLAGGQGGTLSPPYRATVPVGNYDIKTLLTAVTQAMATASPNGRTYSYSFDQITNKITLKAFEGSTSRQLTLERSPLLEQLGFADFGTTHGEEGVVSAEPPQLSMTNLALLRGNIVPHNKCLFVGGRATVSCLASVMLTNSFGLVNTAVPQQGWMSLGGLVNLSRIDLEWQDAKTLKPLSLYGDTNWIVSLSFY